MPARERAWVRLRFAAGSRAEVEDHGTGLHGADPRARDSGWWPCASAPNCWAARSSFSRPAEGGTLVRLRVPKEGSSPMKAKIITCCWPMITRWCGADFAACSKTTPTSPSSAKPAMATEAVQPGATAAAARGRDGLRDAGHERPRRDTKDSRRASGDRGPDAQHALRGDARAAGARCRRAWLRSEECARSRSGAAVKQVAAGEAVLDPQLPATAGAERASATTASRRANSKFCN